MQSDGRSGAPGSSTEGPLTEEVRGGREETRGQISTDPHHQQWAVHYLHGKAGLARPEFLHFLTLAKVRPYCVHCRFFCSFLDTSVSIAGQATRPQSRTTRRIVKDNVEYRNKALAAWRHAIP